MIAADGDRRTDEVDAGLAQALRGVARTLDVGGTQVRSKGMAQGAWTGP